MLKYLLILGGLFVSLSGGANISNIPQSDLRNITYLFERMIDEHDYAYTLFGSKPMSLADFALEPAPCRSPFGWIRSRYFLSRRKASIKAWYKHRNEFALHDFIFLDQEEDLVSGLVLVLINKKKMLDLLSQHEAIFKEELGFSFTPASFLAKLEKKEISLALAMQRSQKLLGIMLGYGVKNATLFQERYALFEQIEKGTKDKRVLARFDAIEAKTACFSELDTNAVIHPLYFLADHSDPETITLKRNYEQERQKIMKLREQPDFMEKVLQRLAH